MIRKTVFLFLVIFYSFTLVGCENYTKLAFEKDINYIEVHIGEKYKRIDNQNTINNLISLIEKSNLIELEQAKDVPYYKIDLLIQYKGSKEHKKITVIKDVLLYNDKYYKSTSNLGEQIQKFYSDINYPELVSDTDARKINTKKINRQNLSLQEALEGYWIDSKGNGIQFKDGVLYQEETEFMYKIESIDRKQNRINISVFALKGFLVKGKKLFDMSIDFDETRNHLKLDKKMVGGHRYKDDMIYIDEDNYKIGTF